MLWENTAKANHVKYGGQKWKRTTNQEETLTNMKVIGIFSSKVAFQLRETWVEILVLLFISYMTLNKALTLHLLICKSENKIMVVVR